MTEIEALEILNRDDNDMRRGWFCLNDFEALEVGKKALEEVEQLRKEMWELNQICRDYTSLGTVEELKEAKEKQIAKKPLPIITDDNEFICVICPTCQQTAVEVDDLYCRKCGQKLVFDWGNEDAE